MIKRDSYLKQLVAFKDKADIIKVITGIRRAGKSTLLELYKDYLLGAGVSTDHIIHIRFESLEFDEITHYKQFHDYVTQRLQPTGMNYLLIDEVQVVTNWERAINSLRLKENVDIVITGSNAFLLSSELSTLISGRYVEISVYPLSFAEFLTFHEMNPQSQALDLNSWLTRYMEVGGFPGLTPLLDNPSTIEPFLTGILNTILLKDIVQHNVLKDAVLLQNILRFLAKSVGSPVSIKRIADYLISSGRRTTVDTVDSYVSMLEEAFLIYRAKRYDIKGLSLLKTNDKFYLTDLGMRRILLGQQSGDYGHLLENLVYFEFLRRGYTVEIGKYGEYEIDFVAQKADEKIYCQVAATILDESTRERELRPLKAVSDFNTRFILSADRLPMKNFDGIKHLNIIEFLLSETP